LRYTLALFAMLASAPAVAGDCNYLCGSDGEQPAASHVRADKPRPDQAEAPETPGLGESEVTETDPNPDVDDGKGDIPGKDDGDDAGESGSGDTGDNGGDTGDTGDNGGDTGDNGGDTGDNGGDTGNGAGDDGNNGHGNDPDHVDESNPGNGGGNQGTGGNGKPDKGKPNKS
jgi:hypothetical protein